MSDTIKTAPKPQRPQRVYQTRTKAQPSAGRSEEHFEDSTNHIRDIASADKERLLTYAGEKTYEYLDHPADIQIHSWGNRLSTAFEQCCEGMLAYMTDIHLVDCEKEVTIHAKGSHMNHLLFDFLDKFLYVFTGDGIICRYVVIERFDEKTFEIEAKGYGEKYSQAKHNQGTEIKAITYSAMQINTEGPEKHVYVIVDI